VDEGDAFELISQVTKARAGARGVVDVLIIDTPPGMPDTAYSAAMAADLVLLPCGPSPLDRFPLKEGIRLALKARAARGAKKPAYPPRSVQGNHAHRYRPQPRLATGSDG